MIDSCNCCKLSYKYGTESSIMLALFGAGGALEVTLF
jgi:hypothetical protein